MKRDPSFPLYAGNWLTSEAVLQMTPEQEGAFVHLLCHAWLAKPPCTVPADEASLAGLSRLAGRWKKVGAAVLAQFVPLPEDPTRLRNANQFEVWSERDEYRKRKAASGAKGGSSRSKREANDERDYVCEAEIAAANLKPLSSSSFASDSEEQEPNPIPSRSRGGSGNNDHRDRFAPVWTRGQFQYRIDRIGDFITAMRNKHLVPGDEDFDVQFQAQWQMSYEFWIKQRDEHEAFYGEAVAVEG